MDCKINSFTLILILTYKKMSCPDVIKLIKSMSKVEKRKFKMSSKKQSGNKDYLVLFDLIDQTDVIESPFTIKNKYNKARPGSSIDNTATYLLKMLTDSLIESKTKEDSAFRLFHGMLRMQVLQERSLYEEGFKELKKLQQLAITSQNHLMEYFISRQELNYAAELNFKDLTEKDLIQKQMKAKEILKSMLNTQEHYSLNEILKYRLNYSGKISSEENKKRLNDLVLNELSLVTGRNKDNYESQKLHLLFQSFFFTDIGDYKSALKTFYELNKLFEQNKNLWSNPPADYFSSLEGILDSLRAIKRYDEMPFYIEKIRLIDLPAYPEFFRLQLRRTINIYQINILIATSKFVEAAAFIKNIAPSLLKANNISNDEKQIELLFYCGLAYYQLKNFKKANQYLNEIILVGKISFQSIAYKVSRLLGLLIYYEDNNIEYLQYAMRSYRRSPGNKEKLLKTETLIFKTLTFHPDKNNYVKNEMMWNKLLPLISAIEKDKYEMQLGKYFDFTGWIKTKFKARH